MALHDLAGMTTLTTGTSDLVLSEAIEGLNTFDNAGVVNGESVKYTIATKSLTTHRVIAREVVTGIYTTSTKGLTRATVHSSTNGGSKISLTGLSDVTIMPNKDDFGAAPGGSVSFATYTDSGLPSTTSLANNANVQPAIIDTEVVDADNLFTLSGNTVTAAADGKYLVDLVVYVFGSGGNFTDGYIRIRTLNTSTSYDAWNVYTTLTAAGVSEAWLHGHVYMDLTNGDDVLVDITNHSGVAIDCGVLELSFTKVG